MKKIATALLVISLLAQVAAAQPTFTRFASVKPKTRGSRYFFKHYVRGFVVETSDALIKKPGYMFNYDKVSGILVMAMNAKQLLELDKAKVRSFTLYGDDRKPYVFERVPAIDTGRFLQVLALGTKYKLYKQIKTDFVRSNYTNDGLTTSGHKYDEFEDDYTYYALNVASGSLQKFTLKNKSLKAAFPGDEEKIDMFLADHPADTIDDAYLTSLGDFMNN